MKLNAIHNPKLIIVATHVLGVMKHSYIVKRHCYHFQKAWLPAYNVIIFFYFLLHCFFVYCILFTAFFCLMHKICELPLVELMMWNEFRATIVTLWRRAEWKLALLGTYDGTLQCKELLLDLKRYIHQIENWWFLAQFCNFHDLLIKCTIIQFYFPAYFENKPVWPCSWFWQLDWCRC